MRAQGGAAELLEVRYMGRTLWPPDEPELSADEYGRRTRAIERAVALEESDQRTQASLDELDGA